MVRTSLQVLFLLFGIFAGGCTDRGATEVFDIVIEGGRVMDPETNFDAIRNVGIRDGLIAVITISHLDGVEVIDATGHVVTAGFIDTHHHGAGNLWGVKAGLRDGITTPMDLEMGAINVGAWYAEREQKWPVNFGVAASHELHRMRVMDGMLFDEPADASAIAELRKAAYADNGIADWAATQATVDQLNAILEGLDEDLRAGALGIASTTGYMAQSATTYEVFNVQKVAANYSRLYGSHVRFAGNARLPTEAALGAFEQIANGVALNQPVLVSHNNNFGWWEVEEHLAKLRHQGYNAWSEYYPYTCGSS